MSVVLVVALCAAVAFFALLAWPAQPEFPPLETKPDDPLMVEAREKARASLGEFGALFDRFPKEALVKLRFVSNSGNVEYLWAEVLSRKSENEYEVRLVTPPVTHSGRLERLYVCKTDDIEDWQVREGDVYHGAFTQRAMFKIAKREGVTLPKKLADVERFYQ